MEDCKQKINGLYPYHHQIIHALNERDYQQRVDFCRWLLTQERENNGFVAEVLFSDEANFTRNGMVNQLTHGQQKIHMQRQRGDIRNAFRLMFGPVFLVTI
ncbi:hypothetical protein Pcinc_007363 [Petrolisthes cinctipes]|uniref:Transposase n=1 Tax=Petrolisthes cinctipes TaxID=88211 RepID=A0AAE1KYA2_PETCI|nr:hypothetical protein Pcinc_007363 [Petrolisthes cinctipes]